MLKYTVTGIGADSKRVTFRTDDRSEAFNLSSSLSDSKIFDEKEREYIGGTNIVVLKILAYKKIKGNTEEKFRKLK